MKKPKQKEYDLKEAFSIAINSPLRRKEMTKNLLKHNNRSRHSVISLISFHKKRLNDGIYPNRSIMEEYVESAGFEIKQAEKWVETFNK